MFASQQPSLASLSQTQQQSQEDHKMNIVGPSDHYGVNHDGHQYQSPNLTPNETEVCVIVDSGTPVKFKIPAPPNRVTLADLKRALPAIDRPSYKYFFKSNDREFGIVREEIHDNDGRLPIFKNRIVAWIVTPTKSADDETESRFRSTETDTCNLTYSNTSYDNCSSSFITTDIDSTSYFTETDDESCLNISRSSSSSSSSDCQTDVTAVRCVTAHLVLTNENFLGLHIYANVNNGVDEGIYVDEVTENSVVALDGQIEPGDRIIQVNDINLEELSNDEAVRVLEAAVRRRGPLKLVVAKFVETNNNKDEAIDGIVDPKEAIHPIDTAAWVAHAQAITMPSNSDEQLSQSEESNFRDIVEQMKMPDSGLEMKDREWLKIQIPRAFLGSHLVSWLERNVYGFKSQREAKKFAGRLLQEGHIRDPISKKPFSSRSYYTIGK